MNRCSQTTVATAGGEADHPGDGVSRAPVAGGGKQTGSALPIVVFFAMAPSRQQVFETTPKYQRETPAQRYPAHSAPHPHQNDARKSCRLEQALHTVGHCADSIERIN